MGALIFYATSGFLPSPSGCRESGEGVGASAWQCARGALLVALPSSPRDNGPIQEHPVKGAFTRGRIGFETIFSAHTQQKNPAMRQHCGIFVIAPEQKICVSKLPLAPFLHLMANIPPVKAPGVLLFFLRRAAFCHPRAVAAKAAREFHNSVLYLFYIFRLKKIPIGCILN